MLCKVVNNQSSFNGLNKNYTNTEELLYPWGRNSQQFSIDIQSKEHQKVTAANTHISLSFQFALLDLDPCCELPGSWWQFMMREAACFPTYIRAVCQQLSSVPSHVLLPASLSLLSITFFSLSHIALANKTHMYAQMSYKLYASRYKKHGRRREEQQ